MLKFCQDNKGSISIFLLIIITAMLFFSFMTFDIAKINLANASARSTTDLIGNAVLADYTEKDRVLKDAYGLIANSRNTDELAENVTAYYLATMASNGIEVSAEEENKLYSLISGLINDPSIAENNNMLQLKAAELNLGGVPAENGIIIQPINESAISNPAVMERQIVEYMKYRGPIELAKGMLQKLNLFTDLGNQANATSARITFEDKLADVQNSSDIIYETFQAYKNNAQIAASGYSKVVAVTKNGKTESTDSIPMFCSSVKNYAPVSGEILSEYGGDGVKAVHESYNQAVEAISRLVPISGRTGMFQTEIIYGGVLKEKADSVSIVSNSPSGYVSNLINFIDSMENGRGQYSETNADGSEAYRFLWKLYEEYSAEHTFLPKEKFDEYDEEMYNLLAASKPIYAGGIPNNESGNLARFYMEFKKLFNSLTENYEVYELVEQGKIDSNDLEEIQDVNRMLTWAYGEPDVYNGISKVRSESGGAIDKFVRELYEDANEKVKKYSAYFSETAGIIFYQMEMSRFLAGELLGSPVDDLKEDIEEATTASGNWEKSIDTVQTDTYKATMKNTYNLEAANFRPEDMNGCDELKAVFSRHAQEYRTAFDSLNSAYGSLFDVTTFEAYTSTYLNTYGQPTCDFKMLCADNSDTILREINSEEYTSLSECKDTMQTSMVSVNINYMSLVDEFTKNNAEAAKIHDVVLQLSEKNIIATEEELAAMKTKGENEQGKLDEIKNAKEEEKNNSVPVEGEESGEEEDEEEEDEDKPSMPNPDDEEVVTFAEYISDPENQTIVYEVSTDVCEPRTIGGSSNVEKTQTKEGDSARSDYNVDGVTGLLGGVGTFFNGLGDIIEDGRDMLYVAEYLTSSFSCLTTGVKDGDTSPENSITGYEFGEENNLHYQAELEYILYGQESEFTNQATAVGIITSIRFALNLIYSFTDKDIRDYADFIANLIGSAAPYTIPIIKIVVHIVISTAETACDMMELCKGNAVPVYKTDKTWVCKCSNIVQNALDDALEQVVDVTVKETTKMLQESFTDFMDDKTESATDFINQMTEETQAKIKSQLESTVISPLREAVSSLAMNVSFDEDEIRTEVSNTIDLICSTLEGSKVTPVEGDDSDDVMNGIYGGMLDYFSSSVKTTLTNELTALALELRTDVAELMELDSEGKTVLDRKFDEIASGITEKINTLIGNAGSKLTDIVTTTSGEVKSLVTEYSNEMSDELIGEINTKISEKLSEKRNQSINMGSGGGDVKFGNSTDADGKTSKKGSIVDSITMTYKEYLYLFLIIGLMDTDGSKGELERAALLMQANMEHRGCDGYDINKAVTMFNVYTGSQVKTSIIGRYADNNGLTMKNLTDGYYKIEIRSFAGY